MRSFKITLIWSEVENDCLLIEKRPFIHKTSRTPQHRHEIRVHTHKCIGNGPVQTQKICMDVTTVKCKLTKPQTDSITVLTFLHTIPAEIYGCYECFRDLVFLVWTFLVLFWWKKYDTVK